MVYFGNNVFRGKKAQEAYNKTFAGKYQSLIKKNHFLYFGLPFMISIVIGSLYLQRFTSVKWEKYDEKYRQLNENEMFDLIQEKRTFNKKKEWYRLQGLVLEDFQKKSNDDFDYEMIRVKRKKEDEPVW